MSSLVPIGTAHVAQLTTKNAAGVPTDADATPIVATAYVNGTEDAPLAAGTTIVQATVLPGPTPNPGVYVVTADTSSLNHGDNFVINIESTIAGTVVRSQVCGVVVGILEAGPSAEICG